LSSLSVTPGDEVNELGRHYIALFATVDDDD